MGEKCRKQVKVGTVQENQMIAIVKKAVAYRIEDKSRTQKQCAELALKNFRDISGIDPSAFTTVDCVAHHVGTLEKIHFTGKQPASGKTKNIQTSIIEKVYPETYGKLEKPTVEAVCELEQNEIPEDQNKEPEQQSMDVVLDIPYTETEKSGEHNDRPEDEPEELDIESFKILRATFELGNIARAAVEGILAIVGVKL